MKAKYLFILGIVTVCLTFFWIGLEWTVNRYSVPEGSSLLLRYKGPLIFGSRKTAKAGHWAAEGEIGVLEKMRGPGRHFYCPVWWERTIVQDYVVHPGEIALVTCKLGDPLPAGEFLVDGEIGETEYKGILRKVLVAGRYRINPYGYDITILKAKADEKAKTQAGWVNVPTGFVGVVTNKTDNPITHAKAGIQDKVMPPGLYPVNPREQQVDIVEIGYKETSINIKAKKSLDELIREDEQGQKVDHHLQGGITFPSSDGFAITLDFTAIWGLMPDQAPNAIRKFGNVDLVEQKIVLPQIESICRNNGSEYSAVELLVGKKREEFQNKNVEEFNHVLKGKDITVLYGLVRHIYIPQEVRVPIQTAFISDELKLTREQEQLTAQEEASLREAERRVELESERVKVQTTKMIAERLAQGQKTVGETHAETRRLVAVIEKETAGLQANAKLVAGQAENEGKKLIEEAKAGKFALAVQAFKTPGAYNNWVFATGLPDDIQIKTIYAGNGTLWTDLQNALRITVPAKTVEKK